MRGDLTVREHTHDGRPCDGLVEEVGSLRFDTIRVGRCELTGLEDVTWDI